ncbi:MAG: EamA family transporter [Treponema sp.]|jgi:drug/metabolite transporter (DMT)-like permease|nr:EamA family transporter [Treponema sp.]
MKNICLILAGVLFNAGAQLLMRKGMLDIGTISLHSSVKDMLPKMITAGYLWLSIACYGISALLWMVILSRVEVSFAYAFLSLGFVIVALMGYLIFNEHITRIRIAGMVFIGTGVLLVSRS